MNNIKLIENSPLHYGMGFFETILIKKEPCNLKAHIIRINKALKDFHIDQKVSEKDVENFIKKYHIKNKILKIIATKEGVFVTLREMDRRNDIYHIGISDVIKGSSKLLRYKTLNYMDNILELRKAKEYGLDDYIFRNYKGYYTESTVANLFLIKDNRLYTSYLEDGVLDGTIRRFIIDHFDVEVCHITEELLKNTESAFLTNSIIGVKEIRSIEKTKYSHNKLIENIKKILIKEKII